jgi:translation initiation factor 4G
MSNKIEKAIEGVDDVEEQAYLIGIIKRAYLGHMRFIGELYKGDLIKLDVMLFCLNTLLMDGYEEENVECFTKLMTTIGFPLEHQSAIMSQAGKPGAQEQLDMCWDKMEEMIRGGEISNRIKFMLQDLIEMKNNGTWLY